MTLHHFKTVITKDGVIKASPGQFFCWSESGKRLELWQEEPLRLLKYWQRESVRVIVDVETR